MRVEMYQTKDRVGVNIIATTAQGGYAIGTLSRDLERAGVKHEIRHDSHLEVRCVLPLLLKEEVTD